MNRTVFSAFLLMLFLGGPAFGQFALSPQLGTDIGGAIPIPFSAIGGSFNAFPKMSAALGARLSYQVSSHWNMGAELNYKTVAMDADARVTNQKFKGEDMVQFFTGTSEISMSFTMLELPLYLSYYFGDNHVHGILLGAYGAYNFKSKFITYANKGYIGTQADRMDSPLSSPMVMDFSSVLDVWDAGVIVGYEARLFPRIHFGLHVLVGMKDVFVTGSDFFDYKMLPMRGSIKVSYDLIRF